MSSNEQLLHGTRRKIADTQQPRAQRALDVFRAAQARSDRRDGGRDSGAQPGIERQIGRPGNENLWLDEPGGKRVLGEVPITFPVGGELREDEVVRFQAEGNGTRLAANRGGTWTGTSRPSHPVGAFAVSGPIAWA